MRRLTVGAGLETKTKAEEIPQNESRMHSFSSKGEILDINQKVLQVYERFRLGALTVLEQE